jgi:hypothetical protein
MFRSLRLPFVSSVEETPGTSFTASSSDRVSNRHISSLVIVSSSSEFETRLPVTAISPSVKTSVAFSSTGCAPADDIDAKTRTTGTTKCRCERRMMIPQGDGRFATDIVI